MLAIVTYLINGVEYTHHDTLECSNDHNARRLVQSLCDMGSRRNPRFDRTARALQNEMARVIRDRDWVNALRFPVRLEVRHSRKVVTVRFA